MGKRSRKRKLKEHMAGLGANDPCVPSQYQVKEIKEIWGVQYAPNASEPPSRPYSPCPLRLRQARQSHQDGPRARGETLGKVCAPSSVHRVRRLREPLAVRLPHDGLLGAALQADQGRQSRAKAVDEIEIFEGNLAQLREDEMEGLLSEDEESD